MFNARLSIFASIFALGAAGAGCKKDPDRALVVFNVQVPSDVPVFSALDFSVETPTGVPPKRVTGEANHRMFRFGYYMPGVNGNVTIVGKAIDAGGCVIGQGKLNVMGVKAGQTLTVMNEMLTIGLVIRTCPSDAGTDGGGGRGGSTAVDGPVDRADAGSIGGSGGGSGSDGGGDGPSMKVERGLPCNAGSECASGFCADGVCCESACSGACEACGEPDMKGQCIAVTGAPRAGHPTCAGAGTPCAGTCDGASRMVCSYPGATQSCRAASCTANVATLSAGCDGKGACPAVETVDCAPNMCAATICAGGCSETSPCTGSTYCAGGRCLAKKGNGQTCAAATECTSGFCADGYCCASACATACLACNLAGLMGTCSAVKSANDDMCSGMQSCDATGACKKASGQTCTAATECTSGNCVDGRCCGGASCAACQTCTGGGGTCVAVNGADDADSCTGTMTCDAVGACKLKAGQACTAASQCVSGFCADGVCCNAACAGACEACAETSSKGTCVAVSGAPRTGRAACTGAGTTCGGSCDGTNRASCGYPGATTSCRSASCTSGTATLAASCTGAGACPAAQTVNCAPNTCSGTACAGGCSSTQPCAGSNYCSGGTCVPKKGNGGACGGATECTSGACVDGVCCSVAACASARPARARAEPASRSRTPKTPTPAPARRPATRRAPASGNRGRHARRRPSASPTSARTEFAVTPPAADRASTAMAARQGRASIITGAPRLGHTGVCQEAALAPGRATERRRHARCPGASTTCRQASCSSGTATRSAVCDGAGNCPAASTETCSPFVCGTNACLTSCSGTGANQCVSGAACIGGACQTCPTGQTACGNVCADLSGSDATHCGSCTTACSGTTPYCTSPGRCVQCRALADCANGYLACSSNACVCKQKRSANILRNPGFDGNASMWTINERDRMTPTPTRTIALPLARSIYRPLGTA